MAVVYTLTRGLAIACFSTFGGFEVRGREAVPPRGRLLVVANHQSNADPPVLAAALPRHVSFVGKRALLRWPIASWYLRTIGSFPIDRDGRDTEAVRWILRSLEKEEVVGIFPEGTRSLHGMRRATHGIAYLALKSNATILPVGITGTEKIQQIWRVPMPLCRLRVNIGQPFSLPVIEGRLETPVLKSLADMIMERVAALLPEKYRGAYGEAVR